RLKRPLGPKSLPIIGNIFDMPKAREWLTYARWSREYGTAQIVHLRVFNTSIFVLSSTKPVNDLLCKRSSIYSDR
ncbi:uncharacterized protein PHACADRAFT_61472, partial [Phanerochaete carnosa HHB-10118-sp]